MKKIILILVAVVASILLALPATAHHKEKHDTVSNSQRPASSSVPGSNHSGNNTVEEGPKGKSPSCPDQDGTGADHGDVEQGCDKPDGETQGDGNNGCGNDADREDDNNGKCGKNVGIPRPRPTPTPNTTSSPAPSPSPRPSERNPRPTVGPSPSELPTPRPDRTPIPVHSQSEGRVRIPFTGPSKALGYWILGGIGLVVLGAVALSIWDKKRKL